MLLLLAFNSFKFGSYSTFLRFINLLFDRFKLSSIVNYVMSIGSSVIPNPDKSNDFSFALFAWRIFNFISLIIFLFEIIINYKILTILNK